LSENNEILILRFTKRSKIRLTISIIFLPTVRQTLYRIVASSSQVAFKLDASWAQKPTQDYRKAIFPTTEENAARTETS